MTLIFDWLALIGPLSVSTTLVLLGFLSRRLGRVTRARPYYFGFFVAALLVLACVPIRANLLLNPEPHADLVQISRVLYHALFGAGVTLGVLVAWRYWSWLLAERD